MRAVGAGGGEGGGHACLNAFCRHVDDERGEVGRCLYGGLRAAHVRGFRVVQDAVVLAEGVAVLCFAVFRNHVALEVGNKVVGQAGLAVFLIHVGLDLCGRACRAPYPHLFHPAVHGIARCSAGLCEAEVAEATDARVTVGGDGACLRAVDVDSEGVAVHHHGDVLPRIRFQRVRCRIHAVGGVPACGKRAVGVGVHHKLPPARAGCLVPVRQRRGTQPEFYRRLVVAAVEHSGNGEARQVEVHHLVHARRCGHGDRGPGAFLVAVERRHGKHVARRVAEVVRALRGGERGEQARALIYLIACQRVGAAHRCRPRQRCARGGEILRSVVHLTLYHHGDHRLFAGVFDIHAAVDVEGRFQSLLIVDDRGLIYMSRPDGPTLRLHDEEIFERLVAVGRGEVGEVVAKFHRLMVQFAVGPVAEHRNGRGGVRVAVVAVAGKLEVLKGHGHVGLRCAQVGRHAGAEEEFAAARVVHLQFNGSLRRVVFAHLIDFGCPPGRAAQFAVARKPCAAVSVGAIDEAVVHPARAPGVHDDPRAHLVLGGFARHAVAVEVKLYAVVVAHDCEGVVHRRAPFLHIVLSVHLRGDVGGGRGNHARSQGAGHADARDAAAVKIRVAVVVPQPVLHRLSSRLGAHVEGEVAGRFHAVLHGGIPFVVALHPAEVVGGAVLVAEERGVGLSAVEGGGGHAHFRHKLVLARVAVGEQPHEVGGIIVFRLFAVEVAVGVEFVGKHVADARCRSARAARLVKHGREVHRFRVVHVVGARGRHAVSADHLARHEQRVVCARHGRIVLVLAEVHLVELCRGRERRGCEAQGGEAIREIFHDDYFGLFISRRVYK